MEKSDPRYLLLKIVKILKVLKIPYMITGGIAVLMWGRVRFTADIDIVVELRREDTDRLEKALHKLGQAGYLDKETMLQAVDDLGEFNFIDGESGVKVDFWILKKDDPFDVIRLKRRKRRILHGERVNFISPEDLILTKLQWYAKNGSSRHLEDIESIFKISWKKLDIPYLKKWVKKLGHFNLLNRMWPQA